MLKKIITLSPFYFDLIDNIIDIEEAILNFDYIEKALDNNNKIILKCRKFYFVF